MTGDGVPKAAAPWQRRLRNDDDQVPPVAAHDRNRICRDRESRAPRLPTSLPFRRGWKAGLATESSTKPRRGSARTATCGLKFARDGRSGRLSKINQRATHARVMSKTRRMPPDPARSEAARKAWRTRRANAASRATRARTEERVAEPSGDGTRSPDAVPGAADAVLGFLGLGLIGWFLYWLVSAIWTCQTWVGVVFVGLLTLSGAPIGGIGAVWGLILGLALWNAWCS